MGSTVNQYFILGVRLDYKEAQRLIAATHGENAETVQEQYDDNGYKKEIGQFEGMTFISDGMNGEYAFFGIIKQKAPADDWLNTLSIERPKLKDVRSIQEKAKALFGDDFICTPSWHVVTHWH